MIIIILIIYVLTMNITQTAMRRVSLYTVGAI